MSGELLQLQVDRRCRRSGGEAWAFAPDVGVVRADREPTGRRTEGWLEGAQDLAVEIIGDAHSASELAAKAAEYLHSGSQAV